MHSFKNGGFTLFFPSIHKFAHNLPTTPCNVTLLMLIETETGAYLHDAIPVVARRDLKQSKEGHAKVFKGSVTTHTFTWIVFIAN